MANKALNFYERMSKLCIRKTKVNEDDVTIENNRVTQNGFLPYISIKNASITLL